MYKIKITKPASKDIRLIVEYLKNTLQNPSAAENLINEIEKGILALKDMSSKYTGVGDAYLSKNGVRCFSVKEYLVFYKIYENDKTVMIIRILFARRDWENLLKE